MKTNVVLFCVLHAVSCFGSEEAVVQRLNTSLECVVRCKGTFEAFGTVDSTSHIWVDGNNIREDRHDNNDEIEDSRTIRCATENELLYWKTDSVPGVVGVAVHRWSGAELAEEVSHESLRFPMDPRMLGLTFFRAHGNIGPRSVKECSLFFIGKRISESVSSGSGGVTVYTFKNVYGDDVEIRTDENVGNQPIYLAYSNAKEGHGGELTTEYELSGDVWFPSRIVLSEHNDGAVIASEEVTIEVISLGERLDESLFTIGGMQLPPKNIQSYPADQNPLHWDGEKIESGYRDGSVLPQKIETVSRSPFYLASICGLVIIGSLLLYRGLFAKKSS